MQHCVVDYSETYNGPGKIRGVFAAKIFIFVLSFKIALGHVVGTRQQRRNPDSVVLEITKHFFGPTAEGMASYALGSILRWRALYELSRLPPPDGAG